MPAQCCKDFWRKLPDDVPVFTIVGYDKLAADTLECWLTFARANGVNRGKINRAQEHLAAIRAYQEAHPEKVKLPD